MILQALLVSRDDVSAEVLLQVLAQFGVAAERQNAAADAMEQLTDARFDAVIVDFDDPEATALVLAADCRLRDPEHTPLITIALLRDKSQIRSTLGEGAHFVIAKPIAPEQAQNTLRAAIALLRRERRQSPRVAVQAAVSIHVSGGSNEDGHSDDGNAAESILIELSNDGMDVLAAQPLPSPSPVRFAFELAGSGTRIEGKAKVAWSLANGETGLREIEIDATMRQKIGEWLAARSRDTLHEQPEAVSACTLTDLSLGGCYVQTESPFPQSSAVDLCLHAAAMEVHTQGLVRVMHPGHGMGIEFPARTEVQRKSVGEFIAFLAGQPGTTPQLEAAPRALVARVVEPDGTSAAASDGDDPLLELLRAGNALEEEAFLAELQRQRTPALTE